ncbi:MAG TPA: MFS transporter [Clostridia bacterium]|nr:MFS transporter [Clostridia bacterium]
MRKSVQLIYLLRFFGTGIIVPVLSLLLLTRGATIETISLVIGLYSLTVILAEFPSGVFADLYGRKDAFLLSCALSLASYCLFLFSRAIPLLLIGMVLNGLSRAFASGSIEALMIDQAHEQQVPIERVTARLSILESAGFASGALLGGLLAQISARYNGNLITNIVLSALLIVLTLVFVHEARSERPAHAAKSHMTLFRTQIRESISFAKQAGIVRILLVLCVLMGFALNSIEIYWQPALSANQTPNWVFGAVSFGGFAFVMLGSWLSERLLRKRDHEGIGFYCCSKRRLGLVYSRSRLPEEHSPLSGCIWRCICSSAAAESSKTRCSTASHPQVTARAYSRCSRWCCSSAVCLRLPAGILSANIQATPICGGLPGYSCCCFVWLRFSFEKARTKAKSVTELVLQVCYTK